MKKYFVVLFSVLVLFVFIGCVNEPISNDNDNEPAPPPVFAGLKFDRYPALGETVSVIAEISTSEYYYGTFPEIDTLLMFYLLPHQDSLGNLEYGLEWVTQADSLKYGIIEYKETLVKCSMTDSVGPDSVYSRAAIWKVKQEEIYEIYKDTTNIYYPGAPGIKVIKIFIPFKIRAAKTGYWAVGGSSGAYYTHRGKKYYYFRSGIDLWIKVTETEGKRVASYWRHDGNCYSFPPDTSWESPNSEK